MTEQHWAKLPVEFTLAALRAKVFCLAHAENDATVSAEREFACAILQAEYRYIATLAKEASGIACNA